MSKIIVFLVVGVIFHEYPGPVLDNETGYLFDIGIFIFVFMDGHHFLADLVVLDVVTLYSQYFQKVQHFDLQNAAGFTAVWQFVKVLFQMVQTIHH